MKFIKTKKIVDANARVDKFSLLFTSCFFTGFIPKASGTFGSLFGLLFFYFNGFQRTEVLLPLIIVCFIIGIPTSKVIMKKYGDDPSVIVIDEVIGMWITVLVFKILIPESFNISIQYFLILFFSFRFFDIFKIQPSKYFDKMKSAFGVLMNDVIAGIYAGIVVYLISLTGLNLLLQKDIF